MLYLPYLKIRTDAYPLDIPTSPVNYPLAWLDLTASQNNHRHVTEYLDQCIDEELPELSDDRDWYSLSFINGVYKLDTDEWFPYWCSGDSSDPEACANCRGNKQQIGGCMAIALGQSPHPSSKYFDSWLDMASIDIAMQGVPIDKANRPPEYRFNNWVSNLICSRCGAPSHEHNPKLCKDLDGNDPSIMIPKCGECDATGSRGHIDLEPSKRPDAPCSCWAPYRLCTRSWKGIPTPYFDSILETQRFCYDPVTFETNGREQEEVCNWIFALMGRLRYHKTCTKWDNWQATLFFVGNAATGKSTIADFAQGLFDPQDVGVMQARTERDFGASALLSCVGGKYRFRPFICAPEMSSTEQGMEQNMWQSIVSRERVTVPIKNVTAQIIVPECQMLMCGNELMNYKDPNGQFSRRVVEVSFMEEVAAQKKDSMLKDRLLGEEVAAWIVKANRAYHEKFRTSGGRKGDLWGFSPFEDNGGTAVGSLHRNLPMYFHNARKRMSTYTNIMKRFFAESVDLIFDPHVYITESELKNRFNAFTASIKLRPQPRWEEKMYQQALKDMGCSREEKGCRKWAVDPTNGEPWVDWNDTFFVGVSVPDDKDGWFARPTSSPDIKKCDDAANGDIDEEKMWYTHIHEMSCSTNAPLSDEILGTILRIHHKRLASIGATLSPAVTREFYGLFHKGQKKAGKRIYAAHKALKHGEAYETKS